MAGDPAARSKLFHRTTRAQRGAAYLAIACAAAATAFVFAWANGDDSDECYMGGLNFGRQMANWHPVFMTAGMLLCGVSSFVTYRIVDLPKSWTKPLHGLLHLGAITFIILGLSTEFISKNHTNKHPGGGYYANLYTNHSLIGLSTVILYALNYVLGALHFLTDAISDAGKYWFLPNYVFIGTLSLVLIVASIESGIVDMAYIKDCGMALDKMNLNPASTYHELPQGCQMGNGAGVLTMFTALFAWYAMFDYNRDAGEKREWHEHALLMDPSATA